VVIGEVYDLEDEIPADDLLDFTTFRSTQSFVEVFENSDELFDNDQVEEVTEDKSWF